MPTHLTNTAVPNAAIFTVGHSTLPIQRFVAVLDAYGIERVVDVRALPRSRRHPQFNGDALRESLRAAGVDYHSLRELGGMRKPRADSPNRGWREEAFRGYADYMQTPEFALALERLLALARERRTAIMCAEAAPAHCHRSLVADALVVRGVPVVEILSPTEHRPHALTSFAVVSGTTVTYPATQPALL